MPEQILMPELGESVHEGTVSRWLKNIGDTVKEDEPVVEIMTDKVNTELQAPAAGVLVKQTIPEGGLVHVFSEIGVIEPDAAEAQKLLGGSAAPASELSVPAPSATNADGTKIDLSGPQATLGRAEQPAPVASSNDVAPTPEPAVPVDEPATPEDGRRWYTPVVRAMAKEHGISDAQLASIAGTGGGGRVTKEDLQAFLGGGVAPARQEPVAPVQETVVPTPVVEAPKVEVAEPVKAAQTEPKAEPAPAARVEPVAAAATGAGQETFQLLGMRKAIADAMVRSSQVPVVSTLIEVDVTPLVDFRAANKDSFVSSHGVKLTYTPFFIKAFAETLQKFPMLNASLSGDTVTTNKNVHMGVAVSLGKDGEGGLIVPVIRDCDSKSLVQIAKDLDEIAAKARANQLGIPDVQGGTFTLTNPGSYGAILGTPMINAPQSGIAGVYGIQQKPVVLLGMVTVRSIMNIVLTYDHRLVDGLTAGRFLQAVKSKLESMDFFK